jgi:hypothetical protein
MPRIRNRGGFNKGLIGVPEDSEVGRSSRGGGDGTVIMSHSRSLCFLSVNSSPEEPLSLYGRLNALAIRPHGPLMEVSNSGGPRLPGRAERHRKPLSYSTTHSLFQPPELLTYINGPCGLMAKALVFGQRNHQRLCVRVASWSGIPFCIIAAFLLFCLLQIRRRTPPG